MRPCCWSGALGTADAPGGSSLPTLSGRRLSAFFRVFLQLTLRSSTTMNSHQVRVGAGVLHAPFAGSIVETDRVIPLVARYDHSAITADGRLVIIDRPSEWPDHNFPSWMELQLPRLNSSQMASACNLVEFMLDLQHGLLSADSIGPALAVAAACCSGSLMQLQQRLTPWMPVSEG